MGHNTYTLSDFAPGFKSEIVMDPKPVAVQYFGPNSVLQQEIPWINYGLYKKKINPTDKSGLY